jgi:general secretion pathway protein F
MAVYQFKGVTAAGKNVNGIRNADSVRTLQGMLRKEGIFPTEISQQADQRAKAAGEIDIKRFTKRVSTRELAVVTRQLATLLHAGVTLVESLTAVVDQSENESLKLVLSQVKQRVNEGSSLADAMGQHPRVFPELYCNMIRAGETSGALDVVLTRLADFTESQARLRSKIIGALTYPTIMVLVGLGIMGILLVAVIPQITKIFEDRKAALPLPTKILLGTANFITAYWWLILIVMAVSIFALIQYVKTDRGRTKWDRFKLDMPVVGKLLRMLAISRFSKTLSTLLKSGVPLLGAMGIVRNIVNNRILAEAIDDARTSIKEGESIAAPLKRSGEFPPLVIHMIAVGERSGQLEEMLNNVAVSYQEQAETRINALMTLLEPLMIVMMGGAVGFMVVSILLPIMQLNEFAR